MFLVAFWYRQCVYRSFGMLSWTRAYRFTAVPRISRRQKLKELALSNLCVVKIRCLLSFAPSREHVLAHTIAPISSNIQIKARYEC